MSTFKEKRLQYTEKAKQLAAQLTLEEKIHLMSGNSTIDDLMKLIEEMSDDNHYNMVPYEAGGIPDKNIPAMKFVDGPRGVVCGNKKTTCFPVSMGRGATFDCELEEEIGKAIGEETLAFGGNTFAGVCINLPYHPGWGRSQETYGEESFHIGQMGSALVRGVQEKDVIACVKHYAFNQMECSRFRVNVDCDKRTEREVFLPHFKDCIDAGAGSVMSSYNLYKGVHCGHSKYLLEDVLKHEWGFDGFIMSDFEWGVTDTVEAANGGQNIEMSCTQYFGDKLKKAVEDGFVPIEKIDDAALRIIRTLLAFEDNKAEQNAPGYTGTPEHIALAKKCALESITLIQNRYHLLPLDLNKTKKLTVVGKLAVQKNIGDHGSSQVRPAYIKTPLDGLKEVAPETKIEWFDGSDIDSALQSASTSDAVLFVLGFDYNDEGEFISEDMNSNYTGGIGGDRVRGLALHEDEINLIEKIAPVNPNSIVTLIGGNTILIDPWKSMVNSILMAYYPGQEGGCAWAEILFGKVNPSGKLPFVIPKTENDLPHVSWHTDSQWYEYYHGYARLEKKKIKPSVPYGYGMSYTEFTYFDMKCSVDENKITAVCKVKNTGCCYGEDVAQLYIGFSNSQIDRPVKLLRGFKRIGLRPDEEKEITIHCPLEKLKWYDPVANTWKLEKMKYEVYLGNSSRIEDLIENSVEIS